MKIFRKIINWIFQPLNNEDWQGKLISEIPQKYTNKDWFALLDLENVYNIGNIEDIFYFVNLNIKYRMEKGDHWQPASETLKTRIGDCEDFAILFCNLAVNAGYNVRVALGYYTVGHAFNIWIKKDKIILIDCVSGEWKNANYTTKYRIEHSFNKSSIWEHRGGK